MKRHEEAERTWAGFKCVTAMRVALEKNYTQSILDGSWQQTTSKDYIYYQSKLTQIYQALLKGYAWKALCWWEDGETDEDNEDELVRF